MKYSLIASAIAFGSVYAKSPSVSKSAPPAACVPIDQGQVIPKPYSDTAEDFDKFHIFNMIARYAPTPDGYEVVAQATNATVTSETGYLNYFSLNKYNPEPCAKACNETEFCLAFNIFFERVPAYEPSVGCPNPEARAAIKCALYGEKIFTGQLTNFGQARGPADANGTAFQVVMSGSNVYNQRLSLPLYTETPTASETLVPTATSVPNKKFSIHNSFQHATRTAAV